MWWLSSIFSGLKFLIDPISKITGQIIDLKIQRANAQTEQEKIHADESIRKLELMQQVMISESKSPMNAIARGFLMFPIGFYFWKVIIWDKCLDLGSTPDLTSTQWSLVFVIYGFYFVQDLSKLVMRR